MPKTLSNPPKHPKPHAHSRNVEWPSIEVIGEEYIDDVPISSRTQMVVETIPPPPGSGELDPLAALEEEIHAPWPVEELEKFAGSRWRFFATVATLTFLGLLVRERGDMIRWLASFSKLTPVKTAEAAPPPAPESAGPCPEEMALVTRGSVRVCVDKWEASLVEIQENGEERPWSPYLPVDEAHVVKAVSKPGVTPQGYIDRDSAAGACESAGKRLCQVEEWTAACEGPEGNTYPYGPELDEKACNIHGKSPLGELFSASFKDHLYDFRVMNDPSLNALEGTVAKTGSFDRCVNAYGIHDIVGNLHEWTAEKDGTFRGGYYQDAHKNGEGCRYATTAHGPTYHDYSTGFRCCKDAE